MTSEAHCPRCGRQAVAELTVSRDQLDNLLNEAMARTWRIDTYGEGR